MFDGFFVAGGLGFFFFIVVFLYIAYRMYPQYTFTLNNPEVNYQNQPAFANQNVQAPPYQNQHYFTSGNQQYNNYPPQGNYVTHQSPAFPANTPYNPEIGTV